MPDRMAIIAKLTILTMRLGRKRFVINDLSTMLR
jgi:hypothetical protein